MARIGRKNKGKKDFGRSGMLKIQNICLPILKHLNWEDLTAPWENFAEGGNLSSFFYRKG
jgi:hypothetical protein